MHFWSTPNQFSIKDTQKQADTFLTRSPHTLDSPSCFMLHWCRIPMIAQHHAASFPLSQKLVICKHSLHLYLAFHIKWREIYHWNSMVLMTFCGKWWGTKKQHRDWQSQMSTGKTNGIPVSYALYFTILSISKYLCYLLEVNNKVNNIFVR